MLATLPLLLALTAPVEAAHPALPSRPTTYPVDTRLTEGRVSNMRELYVSPDDLADGLEPVALQKVMVRPAKPKVVVTKTQLVINDKVYFEFDKAVIKADSHALLDAVAQAILDNPEASLVRVEGHTDTRGKDEYNLALSQRRADAVRAYLLSKGVELERLTAVGKGETELVDQAETEEAHAKNRRVAFMIEQWDEEALAERLGEEGEELETAEDVKKRFALELDELRRSALPEKGALPLINESNGWAKVTVNGTEVGIIGPLTNAVVRDVRWGFYDVTLTISTGYTSTSRVLTVTHEGPVVPGSREAQVAVDDYSLVPSWHDDPTLGHVDRHEKETRQAIARKKRQAASN